MKKTATLTLSQGRYISKIEKLAKERPEECEIVARNKDDSICAHIPVKWVKITPSRVLTDEQKEEIARRFNKNS